jgi:hypothetical protein
LLTPSPVIDPPVNSEFQIEHEINPTHLDSPISSAPAARIVSARLVHS